MEVRLKSIELQNYKGVSVFTAQFGHRTEINGKNAVGKSTVMDAYFDIMTGKMADGSEPDNVRPHNKEGVDIDHIPIVRGVEIEVDGNPVKIEKITEQKWRKPRSQTEEIFDGNVTAYRINGFDKKQKDFLEYMERIGKPDVLLMCSNPLPFINTVRKSTAEARKILEKMSGFDAEEFLLINSQYANVADIVKNNPVETVLKQLRKNLNQQTKARDKARINLEYEKSRNSSELDTQAYGNLMAQKKAMLEQIECVNSDINSLTAASQAYSEGKSYLAELNDELSEIEFNLNKEIKNKRQLMSIHLMQVNEEIARLQKDINFWNRQIDRRKEEITRLNDELVEERGKYMQVMNEEYDESVLNGIRNEEFDESSFVCPTCGQELPEAKKNELIKTFSENKLARINQEEAKKVVFYQNKKTRMSNIANRGNLLTATYKESKATLIRENAEREEVKTKLELLKADVAQTELELSKIHDIDPMENKEYQEVKRKIDELRKNLIAQKNPLEELERLHKKRSALNETCYGIDARMSYAKAAEQQKQQAILALESALKNESQKCADIEKQIDLLLEFSRRKNQVLAEMINPHFKHFQFDFLEYTNEGNPVETCRMVCKGTNYFDGLNGGDKKLVEIDLCRGFQEILNIFLPVWSDEANTIDRWRIPEDMKQQLIVIERTDDTSICVKEI